MQWPAIKGLPLCKKTARAPLDGFMRLKILHFMALFRVIYPKNSKFRAKVPFSKTHPFYPKTGSDYDCVV
jgi:hypothetical protein